MKRIDAVTRRRRGAPAFRCNRETVSLQREMRFAPMRCCSTSTGKLFHCNGVVIHCNGKTASQQRRPFRCNVGSVSLQPVVFHGNGKTVPLQRDVIPLQHEFYFSSVPFTVPDVLIIRTEREQGRWLTSY